MRLNRRTVLGAAAAGVLTAAARGTTPGLRDIASARGRFFGTAAGSYQLKDADFAATLARESAILVPEYELKRLIVEPQPGQFDFSGADALVNFASAHGLKMRGHTCVWYAANPPWLDDKVLSAPDDEIMTFFITKMMARYRGRFHSWDVVNEAIFPADGRSDGLRSSVWLKRFGPSYIDMAYHTAKAADPDALLVYNDWGCEGGEPWNDHFRAVTLKFLEGAKARGVPIEALGLQGHLHAYGPPVDQKKLRLFLDAVKAMGLKILVTELDVDDSTAPLDIATRDRAVADATARFLDVVLDNSACEAVLSWGLTDRYLHKPEGLRTALSGYLPRKLPLDSDLRPKPMYGAIARAIGRGATR
ncbi:MAG: endo-1,4-beta-xylanase [Rhizomicrobium sp.]|nr:endo-1,4-beta-xylanase [Rhizomicrobium sp.]